MTEAQNQAMPGSPALEVTGERLHPEILGEVRQEHMHRYAWSREFVTGKDVLDVASGEGYGSCMLAEYARSVLGVDISQDAVEHAHNRYSRANLRYAIGDAAELPLEDASVDVVTCFETIEHVKDQVKSIREFRRVLRPDGVLLISTPNVETYTIKQHHKNPFHIKELGHDEFVETIGSEFAAVRVLGQRLSVASTLIPEFAEIDTGDFFVDQNEVVKAAKTLPDTMYFVVAAALEDRFMPCLRPSVLLTTHYDVYWDRCLALEQGEHQRVVMQERVAGLEDERVVMQNRFAHLEEERTLTNQHVRNLEKANAGAMEQMKRLEMNCAAAEEQVRALYASTSWKITAPVRQIVRALTGKQTS